MPERYQVALRFIKHAQVIYLDHEIAEQTISIKHTYPLKLLQVCVGATLKCSSGTVSSSLNAIAPDQQVALGKAPAF